MNKKIWIPLITLVIILTLGAAAIAKIYDYDLSEYVTVGEYKGLGISPDTIEVTQEDIDLAIGGILAAAATTEKVTTGVTADGDKVNIDYSGTLDGKAFDGGTAKAQELVLGSGSMIPGFEEEIIGKAIGSTFTIDVTFPEDYHAEDLKGVAAKFEITLNYKEGEPVMPELNEEFVKANSAFATMEEYMAELEKNIYIQKERQEISKVQEEIWAKILESSEIIKYPEKELKMIKDQFHYTYQFYAESNNMEFTDFIATYFRMTEEEFEDSINKEAEVFCKDQMVVYTIAHNEKIEISKEEYDQGLLNMLEKEGFSSMAEFEKIYGQSYEKISGKDNIFIILLKEKVLNWLVDESIAA